MGLYIHIPFCVRKCAYCDFPSIEYNAELTERYVAAIVKEINAHTKRSVVDSVFFGGGTPSLLSVEQFERIMKALYAQFAIINNAEITVEVNPGTIDTIKLECYSSLGVNRLSVGVQSFDDGILLALGRIHSGATAQAALNEMLGCKFRNINIDLMSGVPGRTANNMINDIEIANNLGVEHIALYSLSVESGTEYARLAAAGQLALPDEDSDCECDRVASMLLEKFGYKRYEISNYARFGRECKHNLKYWRALPYIGFGCAAVGYCACVRIEHTADVRAYINGIERSRPVTATHKLSIAEDMSEYMFLGLREIGGVSKSDFYARYERHMGRVYDMALRDNIARGYLQQNGDNIRLTALGLRFANRVFADFV